MLAYPVGQALAMQKELDSNGIIYPSARLAGGTCLVAFRPDLVLNPSPGRTLAAGMARQADANYDAAKFLINYPIRGWLFCVRR